MYKITNQVCGSNILLNDRKLTEKITFHITTSFEVFIGMEPETVLLKVHGTVLKGRQLGIVGEGDCHAVSSNPEHLFVSGSVEVGESVETALSHMRHEFFDSSRWDEALNNGPLQINEVIA